MTLEGDTVRGLTVDTPNETEGLGKRASDAEFTEQFIGKSGPFTFGENGIEALSGATVTSNAALKAINRAYTIAVTGEEPAEEPEATETPTEASVEEKPEETLFEEEEAEETPADGTVERKVLIKSSRKEVVIEGEIITLYSKLVGFDDVVVHYQWQVDRGDGEGWVDVEGATGPNHQFVARKDTILYSWRLIVTVDE